MTAFDKIWKQKKPAKRYLTGISKHVLRLFNAVKARRILDIGAGDGANMIFLAKKGYRAFGLEISEEGVKKARRAAKKENCSINMTVADMFDPLPYADGFFEAVYSYQALNHGRLEQIQDLLQETHRVLKPGGIFSVKTFEQKSFKSKIISKNTCIDEFGKKFKMMDNQTFVPMQGEEKGLVHYFFNKTQLKREVCKKGFRCLDSKISKRYIIANFKKK